MRKPRQLHRFERTSAVLMLGAMVLAFALANSPWQPIYWLVHHLPVVVRIGEFTIDKPLVTWINEGLLVFFFLEMGLEIKRQVLEGRLSTRPQLALPGLAAFGGMAVPAGIYLAFNWSHPIAQHGWAIPTATDIVLALGLLSLLGKRVPVGIKVFLAALAIFDDVGAILIVALFYSEGLSTSSLLATGLGLTGLLVLNRFEVARTSAYVLIGIFLWVALVKSGVHATLAGIAIGFAVPMRVGKKQRHSPLRAMVQGIHPWVALIVVPLFAFFNAGVRLVDVTPDNLVGPVALGVALGLFLGKQIGVLGAAWISVRTGIARLPAGVRWPQIYGAALLAGSGFTMSLFIATLAFPGSQAATVAKLAIVMSSLVSGVAGLLVLHVAARASHHRARS